MRDVVLAYREYDTAGNVILWFRYWMLRIVWSPRVLRFRHPKPVREVLVLKSAAVCVPAGPITMRLRVRTVWS